MEKQMDNVRKETHVVSAMIRHLETDARLREQKDNRTLPHHIRRPRLTERYPQKVQATEEKTLQMKGSEFRADKDYVITCHVIIDTLTCVFIASLGCNCSNKCYFRHVKKRGAKGSVAMLMDSRQLGGCVSQDSHPRKSVLRKEGKVGSNDAVNFSKGTKKIGKERVHCEELSPSVAQV